MLMYFLLFWEATALEVGPVAVVVELASMVEQVLKGVALAEKEVAPVWLAAVKVLEVEQQVLGAVQL